MAIYTATQLDSRNIGSVVKFMSDGTRVHGILELMETSADTIELSLQGSDEVFLLGPTDKVDVILTSEAAFALFSKNALESVRDMLTELIPAHRANALTAVAAA